MITNGVLVATTGHSSTPLTRRGSPGSAPAVNGIPSTSSVAHTANTRDEVIGRTSAQRSDSLFYTYFRSHQNYRQLACHAGTTWEWAHSTRNGRPSRKPLHHTAQDPSSLSQVIPLPETSLPRRTVFSPDRRRARPCSRGACGPSFIFVIFVSRIRHVRAVLVRRSFLPAPIAAP